MAYCTARILTAATDKHTDRMSTYGEPDPEAVEDLAQQATELGVQKVRHSAVIIISIIMQLLLHGQECTLDQAHCRVSISDTAVHMVPGSATGAECNLPISAK